MEAARRRHQRGGGAHRPGTGHGGRQLGDGRGLAAHVVVVPVRGDSHHVPGGPLCHRDRLHACPAPFANTGGGVHLKPHHWGVTCQHSLLHPALSMAQPSSTTFFAVGGVIEVLRSDPLGQGIPAVALCHPILPIYTVSPDPRGLPAGLFAGFSLCS